MPGVLFNTPQVYKVEQRCSSGVNGIVEFASLLIREPDCFDKSWRAFQVLLKEHRRFDAARPALQNRGPIFEKRQYVRADLKVVTQQFKFGDSFVGPVDAIKAGQ